ncbi:AraC family transcriptional regulator [Bacillus sp. FSL K6-6483]|uniref:AraC/XylS family transcriptional regulator n=1 Tax=Shouchella clausii (strain KSM-K16) TaxID=66692 RepID=Q5WL35_SHOC1|nr:AraC family transcriptional regulator [Shouchella clausii]MCM3314333.1 AraC family transcriptional regulator [Psychrobacillus sp. MER TA 17]MCM3380679.1 AraC family transcriptional regulator [Shouchella rhizosphaerae]PAE80168.1 AraC family transcriptional regulator [Shouchella clausii]BAD62920.1 AraC/XylS family transcriptional regulator [Shouchella clausii KSM-K16]
MRTGKQKPKGAVYLYENKHKEKNYIHSHFHYTHQLLYVLDGKGECELGKQRHALVSDNLLIIRPLTHHSIAAQSKMTMLVLEFDEKQLPMEYRHTLIADVFARSEVLRLNLFKGSEVRQLLRRMLYEQLQYRDREKIGLSLLLGELLLLLKRTKRGFTYQNTNEWRAAALKEYIENNYYQLSRAEELAAKMGVSSRYMQLIFKDAYDTTPMRYLTEVRLNRVKKLLIETDLDMVSICFEVGFESLPTFYRVFKKQVGVSPLVYKHTQLSQYHHRHVSE